MRASTLLLICVACVLNLRGQAPSIAAGGVVNAASWSSPIAPEEMVAIFGNNLATSEQSAGLPLPNSLGGTSVTINGVPAPLAFVSPAQINAQVPSSLVPGGFDIGTVSVVVRTPAGISAAELTGLASAVPGFFTADASGCGQAAALNIKPDGAVSLNSASNSAAPGDSIALFGTGFGLATQQPADGSAAATASPLQTVPRLFVDSKSVPVLEYTGKAPSLVGTDQINFQVPLSTRNGCSVPVSAAQVLGSPSVTVSVQNGRGQCSDPPPQSWGRIYLYSTMFSGPGGVNSGFIASFPSGPGVQPPAPESIVYAPAWSGGNALTGSFVVSAVPFNPRTCTVSGYSNLSAGVIQIQLPTGDVVTMQPQPVQTGGVVYYGSLPTAFLTPGAYIISGTPGSDVNLNAKMVVASPIQIQTSLEPGTVISSSHAITIRWTGGDAGTLVRMALYSGQQSGATYDYSYADAASGSLTILPHCSGGSASVCDFALPLSSGAQITVEVLPNPAAITTIAAPGITGPVQVTWQYSYSFPGLVLAP